MAVFQDKRSQTLWMGDLEPEMDESFISMAFMLVQEPVIAVRIIKNRLTGDPAGYCFVEFADDEQAQRALLRLNGKPIPGNMHPPRRFKLNPSVKPEPGEEYSIFVGDLTEDVDDYDLYKTFRDRYPSTKGAKVVLEPNGDSRGFGFVRFSNSIERNAALRDMHFHTGLGGRALKVSSAMPKKAWNGSACVNNLSSPQPSFHKPPNPSPFDVTFSPGAVIMPELQQQQWMQYYQQWQQYYQAQWAQYKQNNESSAATAAATKEREEAVDFLGFDVAKSNEEKIRINRDFDDELHDSQWFDVYKIGL